MSWRRHERAHHRIQLLGIPRRRYRVLQVNIPRETRHFDPFAITWSRAELGYRIVDHWEPDRKVALWMNKPMRQEWKHYHRTDTDHSRAAALRTISYKDPFYRDGLHGALETGDAKVVADTALYLSHLRDR